MSVGADTVTPDQAPGGGMLERFFKFKTNGTTLRRDTIAGLTTFMVMSYIIFVNPSILSFAGIPSLAPKGLPFAAVLTSTCLVAAVMTLIMGLFTNRAYALAPGLGINAVVAFSLVAAGGLTMKGAMGIVVMEGIVITILVLTGLRTAIFKAIPLPLKKAIAIGIGFFILFIGLVDGGVVMIGTPSSTPLLLGNLIGVVAREAAALVLQQALAHGPAVVQLAQQGTKLADMDTNINRRLDELRTKLDDVGRSTESLKTDVAKLSVVSNIFTFGVSSLVTIMFTVVLAVPMTFLVQHFLRKKFPQ